MTDERIDGRTDGATDTPPSLILFIFTVKLIHWPSEAEAVRMFYLIKIGDEDVYYSNTQNIRNFPVAYVTQKPTTLMKSDARLSVLSMP